MAKRRKSSSRRRARRNPPVARANPKRRRRSYRRNPPSFSVKGIMGQAVQGVKDAAALTAGEMATNFVARMVPVTSTVPALAVRVAVAIAAGVAASQTLGRDIGRLVLAGGLSVPLKSAVRAANVPMLTGALSSDEEITRYNRLIGAYPTRRSAPGRIGAYPTRAAIGDGISTPGYFATTGGGNGYF